MQWHSYIYIMQLILFLKRKRRYCFFAEGDEQRMMLMGLRRYTKYVNMPNVVALREKIAAKLITENQYAF